MIIIGLGTRAEAIKIKLITDELNKRGLRYRYRIIATGQHDISHIIYPDIYLTRPPESTSRFGMSKLRALLWGLKIIIKLMSFLHKRDKLIIHGDTLSAVLFSIAGKLKGCEIIHVEAGLRSFNKEPFPEEYCRRIIDRFSGICFTPTHEATRNLEGKGKEVYFVGNTIFDLLKSYNLKTTQGNYVIASIHRGENLRNKDRMRMIVNSLNWCNCEVKLVYHDPLLIALKKYNLYLNKNVKLLKLTNHKEFIKQLVGCKFVISDGGSIMEESVFYKKPHIMMRMWTERKEIDPRCGASKKIVDILIK